jgi:hypothetical protein
MVPQPGEPFGAGHFEPATKCCTYIPTLHNYLVGRILAERDPAMAVGASTVNARIDEHVGVTPLGVAPPSHFALLYGPERFGKSESLRCPYYLADGGKCGVWKHRNAVCSSWFCKHGRGAAARAFWRALEAALSEAERAVAKAVVLELDVGATALSALFPHPNEAKGNAAPGDLDKRVDPQRYAKLWGSWLGKEREFYGHATKVAGKLTWPAVLRLGGSELQARVQIAKQALERLSRDRLPRRLRVGTFEVVEMTETATRIATYTPFDPVTVPNELLAALQRFNGGSTRKALSKVLEEHGLELDTELVQRLVDFEVLVDSEGSAPQRQA